MKRRKRRKQRGIIIVSVICLTFIMVTAYSAFSTVLTIGAKGNVIDLKAEVDSKVPTNELLFWGQADNKDNALNCFKDISGNNNDGVMNGFDNTTTSGFNDDSLIFDGVDDYVNIGLANYDFKNSISYVAYVKLYRITNNEQPIFGNWELNGSGLFTYRPDYKHLQAGIWDGSSWITATDPMEYEIDKYYSLVETYDGTNVNLYVNGSLVDTVSVFKLEISPVPILLGGDPIVNSEVLGVQIHTNMSLREAMLYDRALTYDEVKTITDGFNIKYN